MTRRFLAAVSLAALTAVPAAALPINWTDRQTSSGNAGPDTITGEMLIGGTSVDDTFTSEKRIAFAQLSGGTDYWANLGGGRDGAPSPFTSYGPTGVDNAPTGTDMIALRKKGTQTLSFSSAVDGLYLSFISLNRNTLLFDRDVTLLSSGGQNLDGAGVDACGYWGCGAASTSETAATGTTELSGSGEPHGTIFIEGPVTTLSWTSTASEFWNGFTVGAVELAPMITSPEPEATVQVPVTMPVPLPAGGALLAAALGALGLRRAIRR